MSVAMSAQDALWLSMDRPNNFMVIDGLLLLEGTVSIGQVREAMRRAVDRFPVFRMRARRRGPSWHWEEDPGFDLARHVSRVRTSAPRDTAGLQRWIGERRSVPLDRDRPLWQVHLISPVRLDDGTAGSAVVTRFHHALADGVRATQVMLGLCDAESAEVPAVGRRPAGTQGGVAGPIGAVAEIATIMTALAARTLAQLPRPGSITEAVRSGLQGAEEGITIVRHPDRLLDALEALGAKEHRSLNDAAAVAKLLLADTETASWSGIPSQRKVVAWSDPIPLPLVKAVGRRRGATVNDVMLTAIAGALRGYLAARNESLDEVVWMVPVNLTPFSPALPEALGNHFALVMLPMPLHPDDWQVRLMATKHRMGRIKNSDEAVLTFGIQHALSVAPGLMARFVTNFFANKAVGVLTNVPGPTTALAFGGRRVRQFIGFAPCSGNQPITATIVSYNDTITVGFATDFRLLPDPQELVDLVTREIETMSGG